MKFIKMMICIITCILMFSTVIPVFSEQSVIIDSVSDGNPSKTTEYKDIQADKNEITNPFSSKEEQQHNLRTKNAKHSPEDLTHDTIQTVLKERGILGLSKYQYHQLLSGELNAYWTSIASNPKAIYVSY